MEPVVVYLSFSPADAQLVASRLNAAGLHAEVIHETAGLSIDGYAMAAGGIQVQVPGEEEEAARELVAAKDAE